MINKFAKILEYLWLFISIAGIIITIHSGLVRHDTGWGQYLALTIIAVLMYFWRRKRNKKLHNEN